MGELSAEDRVKVEAYRATLGKYAKPSVTADIIAVRPAAYGGLESGDWRKNPSFAIEVLLIRRGQWPHEGCWALPGGFIRPTESVEEGARRELNEETNLEAHPLIPIGTFSNPKRDMRAWIISNAFVSVYRQGEGCSVKGGDDAALARWLRIKAPRLSGGRFVLPFFDGDEPLFTLRGSYREEDFGGGVVTEVEKNPLAFDHGEIIASAFLRMLSFDRRILAFLFLPEEFTLAQYISVYQYLTGREIGKGNIPNFRRQLTSTQNPLVEPVDRFEAEGKGHAKAQLFRRAAR